MPVCVCVWVCVSVLRCVWYLPSSSEGTAAAAGVDLATLLTNTGILWSAPPLTLNPNLPAGSGVSLRGGGGGMSQMVKSRIGHWSQL